MKKILMFLMIIFAFSLHAEIIAQGDDCGDDCHWQIDTETKTLTITGTGKMTNYETDCSTSPCTVNSPWYHYRSSFDTLKINEGITSVGRAAFTFDSHLKNVELPESLLSINYYAFHECPNIININLPSHLTTIGEKSLSLIQVGKLVIPETVETIAEGAFVTWEENGGYPAQINSIFCTTAQMQQCRAAVSKQGIEPIEYSRASDGTLTVKGKSYANYNDILSGHYIPKRIYTIEEANAVAKPTGNTVRIKYR